MRQALSSRKVQRIARKTGLPVVKVLVRGGTDHRRDLFCADGSLWALFRTGELLPINEQFPDVDYHGVAPTLYRFLIRDGYRLPQKLRSGEVAAIRPMMFTWALFVGLDSHGYRTRFCYPDAIAATWAIMQWDGRGDPPGNWIREKGDVERSNPNVAGNIAGIPVKVEPTTEE